MEILKYFSKEKNSYVNYYEVIYYIPNCHTLFTFAKFPHVINIFSYNHPSYISPTRTFMYIIFHRFLHLYRDSCPISIILIVPEKYLLSYLATWLPSSGYRFNKKYFVWGILKVTQMLSCNSNINTLNFTIKQRYDVRVRLAIDSKMWGLNFAWGRFMSSILDRKFVQKGHIGTICL